MDANLVDQQKGAESSVSGTTLSAQQFYQHDPLLVLLKDTLRLHDLWISAGVMVLPGGVFLFWWLWWASKVRLWVLEDTLSVLLQTFVLFPLIFLIYLLVPISIAGFFNTLRTNEVIGEHRRHQSGAETYETFVQQLVTWMDRSWWTVAIVVIVVGYALYRLLFLEPGSSNTVPYWMRVSAIVIYLPLMYVTGMSVVRLVLALVFTNWLFYLFTLQVKPLHPDGSGGLGILGRLLWVSVGVMLWEALLLSATWLARNLHWLSLPEMLLLGAVYVALTPALLIGWLIFPHRAMVRARDEALQPLADEFQQALLQSLSSAKHDTRSIVTGNRRLIALKQRYELVRDTFPTWPLEISALSRVVVTVILPLILALITSLMPFALHVLGFP
jgi:hypothetical protein